MTHRFEKYCEITQREFLGSAFDTYVFKDKEGNRCHVTWNQIQKVCEQGYAPSIVHNYAIETEQGYVKWASILSEDGFVTINRVTYTDNLQEAQIFSESDYKEDCQAWETFLKGKEGSAFHYKEIEISLK